MAIDDIEKVLDEKISSYDDLSENNPMEGVSWRKANKKYRVRYQKFEALFKTLAEARNETMNQKNVDILATGRTIVPNEIEKKSFCYKDHYFISYWYEDEPYFDIQHVISVLNLKKSSWCDKYKEYSKKVKHCLWHENNYGGYILRELINEKIVYQIILSSNSTVSKSFKKDVSKILCDLRKKGAVDITNDEIKLNENIDKCSNILTSKAAPYTFDNFAHIPYVQHLVSNGANCALSKFIGCHILYAFLLLLKDTKDNQITIKFGYTEDIIERFKSLKSEYKCDIFFLNAKKIHGIKDEAKFHDLLKAKYSHLVKKYKVNGTNKTELYNLNPILINEFDNYLCEYDNIDKFDGEQLEIITYVKNQDVLFLEFIDSCIGSPGNICNYLTTRNNNSHEQYMAKLRYDNFDKEVTLLKLQIKLNKSKPK